MSEESSFHELMQRVRAGDQAAASLIVKDYEEVIRRVVRLRLRRDSPARRVLDSLDVCQAVLGSFFVRAALGQFDLDNPEDLVKLLGVMARNKVVDQLRRPQARAMDDDTNGKADGLVGTDASPSRIASGRELLAMVRERLTEDERRLVEQRIAGRTWAELAAEFGESAESLRKRHSRALDRVAREFDMDGGYDA